MESLYPMVENNRKCYKKCELTRRGGVVEELGDIIFPLIYSSSGVPASINSLSIFPSC